jgi:hypothetical protein
MASDSKCFDAAPGTGLFELERDRDHAWRGGAVEVELAFGVLVGARSAGDRVHELGLGGEVEFALDRDLPAGQCEDDGGEQVDTGVFDHVAAERNLARRRRTR